MGLSLLHELHQAIIERIKDITRGDWKVLVLDENTKKIIDSVVKQDDILNHNIAQIERIEDRREPNPEMDAIYILAPEPYVVDCLLADFERRKYRQAFLVWTSVIDPQLRRRIDGAPDARQMIASFETMPIDFYPRESHLVTFKDPWSFPVLYHPACNNLVRAHMQSLAQKITGLCILLGEYPKVRYYRPRNPLHEASVLCSHLARFIQEELDEYKQWNPNFPPQTSRPQATLLVTDRSMDLMAPLVHEFTYQAMAHDLLDIKEGDKTTYHMVVNPGTSMAEEKDMELSEKDKVWTENRHRHMKDTIDKLMGDFQKFINENPHFTNENSDTTSLNAIRDMLAGLPQFQEMKEAYSLHLSMAQECMNAFQARKLPDIASVEQTLATGLDENFRKPKNTLDDVVPLLDDPAVPLQDRLRLIMIWLLWRDGVIPEDIKRLLAHAGLPPQEMETVTNLDLLGARTTHGLKETRVVPPPLFPKNTKNAQVSEEYALSRFEPVLKSALEELCRGTLDQTLFPYVRPPADPNEELLAAQQGSLRAGRAPRWAQQGRRAAGQNNQRLLVFVAGGATYSEARACYEVGEANAREVVLATSHMLTPQFFLRQVGDLSVDKRRLDLPMERPKRSAPAHLFERPAPPQPATQAPLPGMPQPRPQHSQQQQQFGARPGRAPPPGGLPSRPVATTVPKLPTNEMSNLSLGGSELPGSTGWKGEDGGAEDKKPQKLEKKRRNFLGIKK